jgi:predicted nucleic acid-binding protein
MKDKIFIDSNIFLYTFDSRDERKQKISKEITLSPNSIISIQVINEVSNNLIKKFKFDNSMVKRFIKSCYNRYEVINFTKETFLLACNIRDSYNISYYDSLIVSTALNAKCTVLYSEDMQHGLKIDDLVILNPFENDS